MGLFASKPPEVDLSVFTGQPYPFALMKLYEMDVRVFLVAIKADEEYQPTSEHLATKDVVVILYDAETANVLRCIRT